MKMKTQNIKELEKIMKEIEEEYVDEKGYTTTEYDYIDMKENNVVLEHKIGFVMEKIMIDEILMSFKPTDNILVLGCGNGYEPHVLSLLGFKNVYALDRNDFIVENLKNGWKFIKEDIFDYIKCNDVKFNCIVSLNFPPFLVPKIANFACKRLLKENGYCTIQNLTLDTGFALIKQDDKILKLESNYPK